jgi:hypothetical protein
VRHHPCGALPFQELLGVQLPPAPPNLGVWAAQQPAGRSHREAGIGSCQVWALLLTLPKRHPCRTQSSLTACRHQASAAVSPPSGASQNAWVYICPQTTESTYQLIGMHQLPHTAQGTASDSPCVNDDHSRPLGSGKHSVQGVRERSCRPHQGVGRAVLSEAHCRQAGRQAHVLTLWVGGKL